MFKSSKANMILSLILAVVLWMYVTGQVDPKTDKKIQDVEIELLNINALQNNGLDLAAVSDDNAVVSVEGRRAVLNRMESDDIKLTADLHDCTKGKNTITLKARTSKKADIEKVDPATVDVIIEERVSRSRPVNVIFKGKTKRGMEPGNVQTYPENISVFGAESIVGKVKYIRADVNVRKIKKRRSTVMEKAVPVDSKGKEVKNVWLSSERVEIDANMMKTKKVSLSVATTGEITGDKQLESISVPKTVTIKGSEDTLAYVDEIHGQTVDISGVKETTSIPVELQLPYGVEAADKSKDVSIKVTLKKMSSSSFDIETAKIKKRNLKRGLKAVIIETDISAKVTGTDKQLESLKKEDIECHIDLKGLSKGKHKVRLYGNTSEKVKSISFSPEKVNVEIKK